MTLWRSDQTRSVPGTSILSSRIHVASPQARPPFRISPHGPKVNAHHQGDPGSCSGPAFAGSASNSQQAGRGPQRVCRQSSHFQQCEFCRQRQVPLPTARCVPHVSEPAKTLPRLPVAKSKTRPHPTRFPRGRSGGDRRRGELDVGLRSTRPGHTQLVCQSHDTASSIIGDGRICSNFQLNMNKSGLIRSCLGSANREIVVRFQAMHWLRPVIVSGSPVELTCQGNSAAFRYALILSRCRLATIMQHHSPCDTNDQNTFWPFGRIC
jgi:hypothetical protein